MSKHTFPVTLATTIGKAKGFRLQDTPLTRVVSGLSEVQGRIDETHEPLPHHVPPLELVRTALHERRYEDAEFMLAQWFAWFEKLDEASLRTGRKTRAGMTKGRRSSENPRGTKLHLLPQVTAFLQTQRKQTPSLGNKGMICAAVRQFAISATTLRRWIADGRLAIPAKRRR